MSEPGYWINEQSGVLRPAVQKYFRREQLSGEDIAVLRAYIRQWVMSPVWDLNPHGGADDLRGLRDAVDSVTSQKQIDWWSNKAVELGMDPW